ncbi:MAG TPA: YciI family protein [Candidatus Limnocylindrales bacterium]|nr:YciI family protein [Candidatus Limnocylindrales bacterium]
MSKYLLAVHTADDGPREPMTEEEMRRGFALVEGIEQEMKATNTLLFSGRLLDAGQARVVRPAQGRVKATDGPYAETKEHLGGFYIIEASDMDAALDWASRVTLAIDTPIEVRPFMDEPAR